MVRPESEAGLASEEDIIFSEEEASPSGLKPPEGQQPSSSESALLKFSTISLQTRSPMRMRIGLAGLGLVRADLSTRTRLTPDIF